MAQGFMTGMAGSTPTSITPAYFAYDKRRLDRLVNSFVYMGFGEEKSLPGGMGVTINFRRYDNLTAATTALVEGVTPTGSTVTKTDLNATVAQYGDYVTYTDWIDMVGVDGKVVKIIDELQVDQIAETFDTLVRDMLIAGGTKRYTNGSTEAGINTLADAADFDFIVNAMERLNVKYIKEKTKPGLETTTEGLDAGYIAFIHPDMRSTIEHATTGVADFTGYVPVRHYPAGAKIVPGECGQYGRVKFVVTTGAKVVESGGDTGSVCREANGTNADVHYTIVIGAKAYGNVRLQGGSVKTIIKPLGYKDELDQVGSVGWKMAWGGLVLDADRVHVLVSGARPNA